MICSYGISEKGLARPTNEDSIFASEAPFFILADGMGGYEGGKIASLLAVDTVKKFLGQTRETPYSSERLREAVEAANRALLLEKTKSEALSHMGTTMVVAAIAEGTLYWAHVGDSRLYLLRRGVLSQVTTDHSLVMKLWEEGKITREEMRIHPRKNEITRAVGIEPSVLVDTGCIPLTEPCLALLCSDGLSSFLPEEDMREILQQGGHTEKELALCAEKLMAPVYADGAPDNISVILVYYEP